MWEETLLLGGGHDSLNPESMKGKTSMELFRQTQNMMSRTRGDLEKPIGICVFSSAHLHLWYSEKAITKTPFCVSKATTQCAPSLYEWLIKEQTVVFSGNVGWVGVPPFCSRSRDRNTHKYTTRITMWLWKLWEAIQQFTIRLRGGKHTTNINNGSKRWALLRGRRANILIQTASKKVRN